MTTLGISAGPDLTVMIRDSHGCYLQVRQAYKTVDGELVPTLDHMYSWTDKEFATKCDRHVANRYIDMFSLGNGVNTNNPVVIEVVA